MKYITLNFESRNILTDEEVRAFVFCLYNASIESIYRKHNPSADNETTYIVGYETTQSMDEIIRDIKFLCYIMEQNSIACKIVDDDITFSGMVSDGILDIKYKYFDPLYFITCDQAPYNPVIKQAIDNPAECRCVYSIGRVRV